MFRPPALSPSPSRSRSERRKNRSLLPENQPAVWVELIKPVLDVGSGPSKQRQAFKYQSWSFQQPFSSRSTLVSARGDGRRGRPAVPPRHVLCVGMSASPRTLRVNRPVVMKLLRADSAFPLCASAAGLRCIMHEHSVNLLIRNMSSLFLSHLVSVFLLSCHTLSLLDASSVH